MDQSEIIIFASKLWEIKQEFEDQIRQEERGWQIEKNAIAQIYDERLQKIKAKMAFKIDALETALQEEKIRSRQKVDQAEMALNDLESQLFNMENQGHFGRIDRFKLGEHIKYREKGILNPEPSAIGTWLTNSLANSRPTTSKSKSGALLSLNQFDTQNRTHEYPPETVNFLLNRIKDYFKMMRKYSFGVHRLATELTSAKNNFYKTQVSRDLLHEKCLKYQDLVHGLLSSVLLPLVELNILKNEDAQNIRDMAEVKDMKLTLEVEQMENLIWQLEDLKLHERLEEERGKIGLAREDMSVLNSLVNELIEKNQNRPFLENFQFKNENNQVDIQLLSKAKSQPNRRNTLDIQAVSLFDDSNEPMSMAHKRLFERASFINQCYREETELTDGILQKMKDHIQRVNSYRPRIEADFGNTDEILNINSFEKTIQITEQNQQQDIKSAKKKVDKKKQNKKQKQSVLTLPPKSESNQPQNLVLPIPDRKTRVGFKTPFTRNENQFEVGAFPDDGQIQVKSFTKKKLYYQYDQLQANQITQQQLKTFMVGLRGDAVARKVYYGMNNIQKHVAVMKQRDTIILDRNQFKNTKKRKVLHHDISSEPSYLSYSDSDEQEEFAHEIRQENEQFDDIKFEEVIKTINVKLQMIYSRIQSLQSNDLNFEQEGDILESGLIADASARSKNSGNKGESGIAGWDILPVDCVRIDAYGPPQINVVPLKLLMLKGQEDQATEIFVQALRDLGKFFQINTLKRQSINQSELKHISIDPNTKNKGQTVNLDEVEGFTLFNVLQQEVIQGCDTIMAELENYKKEDKDLYKPDFFRQVKHALRFASNFDRFLKDLNTRHLDAIKQEVSQKCEEYEEEIKFLNERLKDEHTIHEQLLKQLDKLESAKVEKIVSEKREELLSQHVQSFSQEKNPQLKSLVTDNLRSSSKYTKDLSNSIHNTFREMVIAEKEETSLKSVRQESSSQSSAVNLQQEPKIETRPRTAGVAQKVSKQQSDLNPNVKLMRQNELVQRGFKAFNEDNLEIMDQNPQDYKIEQQSKWPKRPSDMVEKVPPQQETNVKKVNVQLSTSRPQNNSIAMKQSESHETLPYNGSAIAAPEMAEKETAMTPQPELVQIPLKPLQIEGTNQTDVSMDDLSLFLDFKRRAIVKIQALEDEVQELKSQQITAPKPTLFDTTKMNTPQSRMKIKQATQMLSSNDLHSVETTDAYKGFKPLKRIASANLSSIDYYKNVNKQRYSTGLHNSSAPKTVQNIQNIVQININQPLQQSKKTDEVGGIQDLLKNEIVMNTLQKGNIDSMDEVRKSNEGTEYILKGVLSRQSQEGLGAIVEQFMPSKKSGNTVNSVNISRNKLVDKSENSRAISKLDMKSGVFTNKIEESNLKTQSEESNSIKPLDSLSFDVHTRQRKLHAENSYKTYQSNVDLPTSTYNDGQRTTKSGRKLVQKHDWKNNMSSAGVRRISKEKLFNHLTRNFGSLSKTKTTDSKDSYSLESNLGHAFATSFYKKNPQNSINKNNSASQLQVKIPLKRPQSYFQRK